VVTRFAALLPLTGLSVLILETARAPARRHRPDIPPELEAVLARCLTKDRDRRFQTAADLAVALLPFAPKRARVAAERAVALADADRAPVARVTSLPAPHANTALALDVDLIPLSAKHIITHPEAERSFWRATTRNVRAAAVGIVLAALGIGLWSWRASPPRPPAPIVPAAAAASAPALPPPAPDPVVVAASGPPAPSIAPAASAPKRARVHAVAPPPPARASAEPPVLEIQTRR
jgi:serine/threonine-protein kinase